MAAAVIEEEEVHDTETWIEMDDLGDDFRARGSDLPGPLRIGATDRALPVERSRLMSSNIVAYLRPATGWKRGTVPMRYAGGIIAKLLYPGATHHERSPCLFRPLCRSDARQRRRFDRQLGNRPLSRNPARRAVVSHIPPHARSGGTMVRTVGKLEPVSVLGPRDRRPADTRRPDIADALLEVRRDRHPRQGGAIHHGRAGQEADNRRIVAWPSPDDPEASRLLARRTHKISRSIISPHVESYFFSIKYANGSFRRTMLVFCGRGPRSVLSATDISILKPSCSKYFGAS